MGTAITSFLPCGVGKSPEIVQDRLNSVFKRLSDELTVVATKGRFSGSSGQTDWGSLITEIPPNSGEPGYISGEGPFGFSISVFAHTVMFTSNERFGTIQYSESGVSDPLRRIFEAVAEGIGQSGNLAIAASGLGDTDRAADLAFLEGSAFEDVCRCLESVLGAPARNWKELEAGGKSWLRLGG